MIVLDLSQVLFINTIVRVSVMLISIRSIMHSWERALEFTRNFSNSSPFPISQYFPFPGVSLLFLVLWPETAHFHDCAMSGASLQEDTQRKTSQGDYHLLNDIIIIPRRIMLQDLLNVTLIPPFPIRH